MTKNVILFASTESDSGSIHMPTWWINFIDTVPILEQFEQPTNAILEAYNAKSFGRWEELNGINTFVRYLSFATNEDYVNFILRWS